MKISKFKVAVAVLASIALVSTLCPGAFAAFTAAAIPITNVQYSSVAWADYDNDGDPDLAIMGSTGSAPTTKIYRNNNGTFTNINAGLVALQDGSLAWGDFDNDGDLDLALAGGVAGSYTAKVYRNTGGTFTDAGVILPGVRNSCLSWGDYDNDGDLDLAMCGYCSDASAHYVSKIYRNDAGVFTDINAGLTGINKGAMIWGDYDNDGDLDLALVGYTGSGRIGKIYRNDAGMFVDTGAAIPALESAAAAWSDYDNDGDLDLAICGYDGSASVTKILNNNHGVFTDSGAALVGVRSGSLAWGDYDNDGDPDLLVAGDASSGPITNIYRNDGGAFTDSGSGLTGLRYCGAAWADYDKDGDLDLAIAGSTGSDVASLIYRNNCATPNIAPSTPTGLAVTFAGSDIVFGWSASSDAQTPAAGLSYNLRVGTMPGGNDICSGTAIPSVPAIGNAQKRLSWTIKGIGLTPRYWSVQAIDPSFGVSAWATEKTWNTTAQQLKALKDDATASWNLASVTAIFGDSFYLEDEARTCGILAKKTGHTLTAGKKASVSGTMKTNSDGERYILATTATPGGDYSVAPLAMSNQLIGGKDVYYNPVAKIGQQGVKDAASLGNIGLLVRTSGTVTQIGADYIYIDDGSGLKDGTFTGLQQNVGVRISCNPSGHSSGDYVSVTGVSSCFRLTPTELGRKIWATQITKLR